MKGKKRFVVLLTAILTIVAVTILSVVISNHMLNDQTIIISYEAKKQKCELLRDIAEESVQEGIGIDTKKITNEKIKYHIYNDNENIIFYYYLQDNSTSEPTYNATITLSNDYRILREDYSIELESFDEFSKNYNFIIKFTSLLLSLIFVALFYCLAIVLKIVVRYKDQKKEQLVNKSNEAER